VPVSSRSIVDPSMPTHAAQQGLHHRVSSPHTIGPEVRSTSPSVIHRIPLPAWAHRGQPRSAQSRVPEHCVTPPALRPRPRQPRPARRPLPHRLRRRRLTGQSADTASTPPTMTQAGLRRRNVGICRTAGRPGAAAPGAGSGWVAIVVPLVTCAPLAPMVARHGGQDAEPPTPIAADSGTCWAPAVSVESGATHGATPRGVDEVRAAGGGLGC
jgi:hypothetical protein